MVGKGGVGCGVGCGGVGAGGSWVGASDLFVPPVIEDEATWNTCCRFYEGDNEMFTGPLSTMAQSEHYSCSTENYVREIRIISFELI